MIALIDGDIPVYTTCFACKNENDWHKVRHTANVIIQKIIKDAKATQYLGFLTNGKANFRVQRATTWPYKGNRATNKEKPRWFDEVRKHYEEHWKFQEMKGIEADDALTIAAEYFSSVSLDWIICTKDKDLWQYPGQHLDMNRNKRMTITEAEGHRNLWKQVMLGDVGTDNIPGLSHAALYETKDEIWNQRVSLNSDLSKTEKLKLMKRPLQEFQFGATTCKNLLDEWKPEEYPERILEMYVSAYEEDPDPSFGEDRFYETFDLVYMLRELPKHVAMNFVPLDVPTKTLFAPVEFEDESETDLEF